jgi:DNA-3-methyladenine glycosylase II
MRHLITLHPKHPYNFSLLLDFLTRLAHPTLNIVHDGALWRVISANSGLVLLRVSSNGTADAPQLDVEVATSSGDVDDKALIENIKHVLPTHHDWSAFYSAASADAGLWGIVKPLVGLPELRTASLFEALMLTTIEQQINWMTAQKAQRWLIEWAGNKLEYEGRVYYAFPTPAQIAAATVEDLKPLKITFKRMAMMIELSKQVANAEFDLEGLRNVEPMEAYKRLTGIKGIGHWTAAVTLERALGYTHWVAYNDVGLQAATNRYLLGGSGRIPAELVSELFARYGEYAGLAARYTLFRWVFEQYPQRINES